MGLITKLFGSRSQREIKKILPLVDKILALEPEYKALSECFGIRFADAGKWDIPLTFDGVHFTGEGHEAFAEGLVNYLNEGE